MFLPDYVKKVLNQLEANGFEGYIVGGCVRDKLLGDSPNDYDIAVSSTPEETKNCFAGWRIIETGLKHGTVTVVSDKKNLELTSFRVDGEYKDCRRPENVKFTRSLEEDLSRRDFTVNAIAYSEKTGIVDIFGGEADIRNKIIRCVGNPDTRFNEDALRIMRGIRFCAVLGFDIEENTAQSIHKNKALLKNISVERIFIELKKLLTGKNAFDVLINYRDVLEIVIPELKEKTDKQYFENVKAITKCNDAITAFAALICGVGEEKATEICLRLKTDKFFRTSVENLEKYKNCTFNSPLEVKHLLKETSENLCVLLTEYKNAFGEDASVLSDTLKKIRNGEIYSVSGLNINGKDLTEMGFTGKEIGNMLNLLLDKVISGEVKNKKKELMQYITKGKCN